MSLSESASILKRGVESYTQEEVQNLARSVSRVGVLSTLWYPEIMEPLKKSATEFLLNVGVASDAIVYHQVPGSFELPLGVELMFPCDFVVALGCVVQGDTPHFDYVCQAATQGLMQVQLKHKMPVGFGLLTVSTLAQAMERKGKGAEAAHAAFNMYLLSKALRA